jgi:hypothetical protein
VFRRNGYEKKKGGRKGGERDGGRRPFHSNLFEGIRETA